LRALVGFLFPHRWKGQLAEAKRLLASGHGPLDGLGEKIDAWLESPCWEVRNVAVKLVAHVRDQARYHRLIEKLTDPTEAGIVRRNVAEAIARIGLRTDPARAALLLALPDPYWEVRAEAVRALAALFPPAEDLEQALLDLLYGPAQRGRRRICEDNFEVRMAIAQGLGHLGVRRAAFGALAELARDDFWPVRSQAAVALTHFAARQADHFAEARELLLTLDRQSEGAVSYFVHRDLLSQALRAIHKGPGGVAPQELSPIYLNPKAGWNQVRR